MSVAPKATLGLPIDVMIESLDRARRALRLNEQITSKMGPVLQKMHESMVAASPISLALYAQALSCRE